MLISLKEWWAQPTLQSLIQGLNPNIGHPPPLSKLYFVLISLKKWWAEPTLQNHMTVRSQRGTPKHGIQCNGEDMKCPICGIPVSEDKGVCTCGYVYTSDTVDDVEEHPGNQNSEATVKTIKEILKWCLALLVPGVFILLVNEPTTPVGRDFLDRIDLVFTERIFTPAFH